MNAAAGNNPAAATEIAAAAACLRRGGVAAFPTDTLYGLGADVFNAAALERVFAIKRRPEGLALPALLGDLAQLDLVAANLSAAARKLAAAFWPGPLTLVVGKAPAVPARLTAGAPTVAVRLPGHPVPCGIARALGRPITGTSANLSGAPDPQTLDELRAQIGGAVDCIVAAGPPPAGAASTIIDVTAETPRLLRAGAVSPSQIAAVLGAALAE